MRLATLVSITTVLLLCARVATAACDGYPAPEATSMGDYTIPLPSSDSAAMLPYAYDVTGDGVDDLIFVTKTKLWLAVGTTGDPFADVGAATPFAPAVVVHNFTSAHESVATYSNVPFVSLSSGGVGSLFWGTSESIMLFVWDTLTAVTLINPVPDPTIRAISVVDDDGDGFEELYVVMFSDSPLETGLANSVRRVVFSAAGVVSNDLVGHPIVSEPVGFASVLDFDLDGFLDLVLVLNGEGNLVYAHFGLGDGSFASASVFVADTGYNTVSALAEPMGRLPDGSPRIDLVVFSSNTVRLLRPSPKNRIATFATVVEVPATAADAGKIAIVDVNGDGAKDISITPGFNNPYVLFNDGNGAFPTPAQYLSDVAAPSDVRDAALASDAASFDTVFYPVLAARPGRPTPVAFESDANTKIPWFIDTTSVSFVSTDSVVTFTSGSLPRGFRLHTLGVADMTGDGLLDVVATVRLSGGTYSYVLKEALGPNVFGGSPETVSSIDSHDTLDMVTMYGLARGVAVLRGATSNDWYMWGPSWGPPTGASIISAAVHPVGNYIGAPRSTFGKWTFPDTDGHGTAAALVQPNGDVVFALGSNEPMLLACSGCAGANTPLVTTTAGLDLVLANSASVYVCPFQPLTSSFATNVVIQSGLSVGVLATGDFTGDALDDILYFDKNVGGFYLSTASGPGNYSAGSLVMPITNGTAKSLSHLRVADFNMDGVADALWVESFTIQTGPYVRSIMLALGGPGGVFQRPVAVRDYTEITVYEVVVADISHDGFLDILIAHDAVVTIITQIPNFGNAPVRAEHAITTLGECAGAHGTMSCLAAAAASGSPCWASLVPLASGQTYGCWDDQHIPVTSSVTFSGTAAKAATGQTPIINCTASDSLIAVGAVGGVTFEASDGAALALADVIIEGADNGYSSTGVSAVRASGLGTTLTLSHVEIRNCVSLSENGLRLFEGYGGAVSVISGASADILNSTFANNVASIAGGALGITYASRVLVLGSTFVGNEALGTVQNDGGGGAISTRGVTEIVTIMGGSTFTANTAASGLGGAIWSDVSTTNNPGGFNFDQAFGGVRGIGTLVLDSTFEDNVAKVGGAIGTFRSSPYNVYTVYLDEVEFRRNSARWGAVTSHLPALGFFEFFKDDAGPLFPQFQPGDWEASIFDPMATMIVEDAVAEDNTADYGGFAFVCGTDLQASTSRLVASGNVATRGGGFAFVCHNGTNNEFGVSFDSVELGLGALVTGFTSATSWGDFVASAVYEMVSDPRLVPGTSPISVSSVSGMPLTDGVVALLDEFGQVVRDASVSVLLMPEFVNGGLDVAGGQAGVPLDASTGLASLAGSIVLTADDEDLESPGNPYLFLLRVKGANPRDPVLEPGFELSSSSSLDQAEAWDSDEPETSASTSTSTSVPTIDMSFPGEFMYVRVDGCGALANGGRLSATGSPLVCGECLAGTKAPPREQLNGQCVGVVVCLGQTRLVNETCVPCPINTRRYSLNATDSSASVDVCECVEGFWNRNTQHNEPCEACPRGAVCSGGLEQPRAAPGYFPASEQDLFVACPNPAACAGDGSCREGYTARMCAECAAGFYELNGRCHKCDTGKNALVIVLVLIALLILVAALVGIALSEMVSYKFAAAMIGLSALQISAMYGKLELDFGRYADAFFDVVSVVNLNFELTSPECAASDGIDIWVFKWVLTMLLPVFALAAVAAISLVVYTPLIVAQVGPFGSKNLGQLVEAAKRTWYQLIVMLYLPLTAAAFSVFGCQQDASGRWVMNAAPSRSCFTSSWWGLAVPGAIAVLIYAVGLPLGVVLFLRSRLASLDDFLFTLRYGFLVGRFTRDAWFFEAVIMGRKLSVIMCMTFFAADQSKASAAVVALVGSCVHLGMSKPYRREFHNALALVVLTATTLILAGTTFANQTARYVFVGLGVTVTLAAIVVGNAIDLWLIAKAEEAIQKDEYVDDSGDVEMLPTDSACITSTGLSSVGLSVVDVGSSVAQSTVIPQSVEFSSLNDRSLDSAL